MNNNSLKYINDLEYFDDEETKPIDFWKMKQREVSTSTVDYNLSTVSQLISEKMIDLNPSYQRRTRWDEKTQSRLIESFFMNVPIPPIFLNEDESGNYSVIDGKQRLIAIQKFLTNDLRLKNLEVFNELEGMFFNDIPLKLQTLLRTRSILRAIIILSKSDRDIKFEVFRRINTGGVSLNAQEIRNSAFPGNFNDLLIELSEIKKFHELLGIKSKEKSSIYQEMRDVEFVLRYFTFRNNWENFSGGLRENMDHFIMKNRKLSINQIEEMRLDFINTLHIVELCFGKNAFKRWNPEKKIWKSNVVAALYDAQMFACRGLSHNYAKLNSVRIIERYKKLFENSEFRKSIDAATNTPSYFISRITLLKEIFS